MLEAVIALFITAVAVMGTFALMAPSWRTTSRSDFTGRAANILHDQLQRQEVWIMNSRNAVATGKTGPITIYPSGGTAPQFSGDAPFDVTTTITSIGNQVWRVTVRVDRDGYAGISESLVVTRQNDYRFP